MANVQTASALNILWRQAPGGELLDIGRPFRDPLSLSRLQRTPGRILSRREAIVLVAVALTLHGAVIYWISQAQASVLPVIPPEIPPMTIEFSRPAPPVVRPPPEPIAQPVVEPPPLVEDPLAAKPPPKKPVSKPKPTPLSKPVTKPVAQSPAPQPVAPPAPPAPTAPPAPPAPPSVTPASVSAGYLNNPAPQYPALAMRRGWEGRVVLRVHVLASGKPGEVQIQKSSGREQLDNAALAAVKLWSFVPAKQGDIAQDGWVSVPIDFNIK